MENPPADNDNPNNETNLSSPEDAPVAPPLPTTEEDSFPWEDERLGFFDRYFQTLFRTFVDPWKLYAAMPVSGGYRKPMVFLLISTVIASLGAIVMMVPQMMMMPGFSFGAHQEAARFYEVYMVAQLVYYLLCIPLVFIMLFVFTPISHGVLMLVGGAKNGFEATLRTQAYCTGLWGIVVLLPCIGALIAFVWGPIVETVALKKAQQTGYWQAAFALVPMYFISFLFIIAFYLATLWVVALIMAPEVLEMFNHTCG